LDIPEGRFLGAQLLLQGVFELAQDALEVVLVLEPPSAVIPLGLSDDFKWIFNTSGEVAVIQQGRRACWREGVVGVGGKGNFNRFDREGRAQKDVPGNHLGWRVGWKWGWGFNCVVEQLEL
jgi:hypothetical protein